MTRWSNNIENPPIGRDIFNEAQDRRTQEYETSKPNTRKKLLWALTGRSSEQKDNVMPVN